MKDINPPAFGIEAAADMQKLAQQINAQRLNMVGKAPLWNEAFRKKLVWCGVMLLIFLLLGLSGAERDLSYLLLAISPFGVVFVVSLAGYLITKLWIKGVGQQIIHIPDSVVEASRKHFHLPFDVPPCCTGETMSAPSLDFACTATEPDPPPPPKAKLPIRRKKRE
jgi:hypothetical protein